MLLTARGLVQLLSCLHCLLGWGLSSARLYINSTVCDLQGSCHPYSMARGDLHRVGHEPACFFRLLTYGVPSVGYPVQAGSPQHGGGLPAWRDAQGGAPA